METMSVSRLRSNVGDNVLIVPFKNSSSSFFFFFFNDTATTEIYTLSLHDALPIWKEKLSGHGICHTYQLALCWQISFLKMPRHHDFLLRRSEEHTSELQSPVPISYAVFCLKKKKKTKKTKKKKKKIKKLNRLKVLSDTQYH